MNVYDLSRKYWDFAFENPDKIKPNHTALYFFAIEHCNRLGWKDKFGFPTSMAMEAISIKSYNTFIKTLHELVEYGFITMIQKSTNQYSANIIALSKFNKANNKALDEALIKHSTKQVESTEQSTSESTVQSIDSINKQTYNTTNIPINNVLFEKEPNEKKIELEIKEDVILFEPDIRPSETPSKKVAQKNVSQELNMPADFIEIWDEWNQYRKDKRIKAYAGPKWEQLAVDKLLELSNRDPATAKLILKQTYENNYQGFFPLKNNYNGQSNNNNSGNGSGNRSGNTSIGQGGKKSTAAILAERARNQAAGNGYSGNFTGET